MSRTVRKKQQRGFTLLEALVATMIMGVAIAGILDALAASSRNASRLTQADRAGGLRRTQRDYVAQRAAGDSLDIGQRDEIGRAHV